MNVYVVQPKSDHNAFTKLADAMAQELANEYESNLLPGGKRRLSSDVETGTATIRDTEGDTLSYSASGGVLIIEVVRP